ARRRAGDACRRTSWAQPWGFSTASMTSLAIGPPRVPPWISSVGWSTCWSITQTATFGDWAGANPTNQAYGGTSLPSGFVRPLWAVPVLPATWMPGIAAGVAVPLCTVATIILVTSLAVVDEVAWASWVDSVWRTVSKLVGDCAVSQT